ncbi:MAG: DUF4391 domain-containing protein [Lachnospiraceae bacterium]|nr:DUF4391 domain-containing protein [Lachnospiraceae bacterium]MDE7200474.1 DUF4391 domain-containing protein [Lachnospiraceae bacterium]
MIDFPAATVVHRRMPKEAFYKHLPLTKVLREKFISDVDRVFVENSLTKDNLNLTAESEIKEILLLALFLKKQEFDAKIIEAIAKQNPHKLIFLLIYEDSRQLAIWHGKLYFTEWVPSADIELKAQGFSLDEIWDSFIEQIAIYEEYAKTAGELSIDERLAMQEQITRLEKQIQKTEAAAWKEQQPKKRFELYQRLQGYKSELEELMNNSAL